MKLKTFDRTQSKYRFIDKPAISFNSAGVIRINKCASERIGLKSGDKMKFYQDEDNPEDWYVAVVPKTDELGLRIRQSNSQIGTFCLNSIAVVKNLYESIGFRGKTIKFQLGSEPLRDYKPLQDYLWAIITAMGNKNNES